jgi:hypothetical protein
VDMLVALTLALIRCQAIVDMLVALTLIRCQAQSTEILPKSWSLPVMTVMTVMTVSRQTIWVKKLHNFNRPFEDDCRWTFLNLGS